jgi:hypothetical protein
MKKMFAFCSEICLNASMNLSGAASGSGKESSLDVDRKSRLSGNGKSARSNSLPATFTHPERENASCAILDVMEPILVTVPSSDFGVAKGTIPKPKRYLTNYLPGDVIKAKDGSIGLITQAKCIVSGSGGGDEHMEWNYMWSREGLELPQVLFEDYQVAVIPGYPCSKLAWWRLVEIEDVMKGPMHEVLGGYRFSHPSSEEKERKSQTRSSSIAPFGRGTLSIRVTRKTIGWNG